ncbi:hypothetical protein [Maribacter ulvicola]|uniref:Uncharacterized protein n=1 Tax=Maribacter ulvicola TaxID=228959 RepID=A0A1N6ZJ71_9FLAO|nr:hypothetical protein [Maribacter ulvicola]SIR26771.1 hypothetical protein SAMN05421797_1093 [Maribacter ulvicola]
MKKVLDRWYIGLILLPIIMNLTTAKLDLPILLKNWNFTIIGTLIITNFIAIYEFIILKKENKRLNSIPKESDKKIIKNLLKTLDVISFQDKISEQSSWYGYEKTAMQNTFDFCEKARLINYKTADEKLNNYIQELRLSLDEFHEKASRILYSDNNTSYTPDKRNEVEVKKTKEAYPEVDKKSIESFKILSELLKYLKENNYLE